MAEKTAQGTEPEDRNRFEIFRGNASRDYMAENLLKFEGMTPVMEEGLKSIVDVAEPGGAATLVYARDGFSITHVWFKSGYPLPLHSHSTDCVYYIIAGSIAIGKEELGVGDGFFVGGGVPYTYKVGSEGVEVLEFRDVAEQDIRYHVKTEKLWSRIAQTVRERQSIWAAEKPPSQGRIQSNSLYAAAND